MLRRAAPRERQLALLYLTGSVLTFAALALPYDVEVSVAVRLVVAVGALAIGLALLRAPALPDGAVHGIVGVGLLAVTACTTAGVPEIEGPFFFLPLVFVFATFPGPVALAYLAAGGALYAGSLAVGAELDEVGPLTPWVLVMGVATVLLAVLQAGRRNRRIAEALQATLLPSELPSVPGLQLAARYVPAAREADVGGDLFDAFVLPDGRLAVLVGDVAGKGLRAAAAVGPLRTAVRAHALEGAAPAQVLDRVEHALGDETPMTTALLAVVGDGELVWASAGHVPPVLVPATGPAVVLEGPTRAPLGAEGLSQGDRRAPFGPGDRLVLVTDGLVEQRGESLAAGLERLREALQASGAGADGALAAALASGPDRPGDDIAVLVVARG
jgi:hypothetical protein